MSRFEQANSQALPVLTRTTESAKVLTVVDLFNTDHSININAISGKDAGMSVMIDGHIWVAEGRQPSDGWHRMQKHVEVLPALYRQVDNTLYNTSDGTETWYDAALDNLIPVESFYAGDWEVTEDTGILTYIGEKECIFRFTLNGDVTDGTTSFGDTCEVQFYRDSTGEGLTGMTKAYPFAKTVSGTVSTVDFTLIGWARVQPNEVFRIQVTSNIATDLTMDNVMFNAEPLDALLYN